MSYDNHDILFWESEEDRDECYLSVCSMPNDEPEMCLTIYTAQRGEERPTCTGLSLDQVKKLRNCLNDVIKKHNPKELRNILNDDTAAKE